jgi:hypothetical protein
MGRHLAPNCLSPIGDKFSLRLWLSRDAIPKEEEFLCGVAER